MNNIVEHYEIAKNGVIKLCITQIFYGKDHTIEHVLCSGSYDPEFGDLSFHFSVDGRKLSVSDKFKLLYRFAIMILR